MSGVCTECNGKKYLVEGKRIPELVILNPVKGSTWIPIYDPSTNTTKRVSITSLINFVTNNLNFTAFTEQQVRDTPLTGLVFTDGTAITSVDTVIIALGKLQTQINNIFTLIGSSEAGIIANASGTQAGATQLTAKTNRIDVCATDLRSVKTFPALDDLEIYVQNATLNKVNIYPTLGERFRKQNTLLGINVPIVLPSRTSLNFYCFKNENGIFTVK